MILIEMLPNGVDFFSLRVSTRRCSICDKLSFDFFLDGSLLESAVFWGEGFRTHLAREVRRDTFGRSGLEMDCCEVLCYFVCIFFFL